MANQITDGRTSLFTAETVTGVVDLTGAANGTLDNEIFYQGSNSVGGYCTTTRDGLLYNAGSTQSAWANSHFYILVNCGIVGLLDTKANGGLTIRFCGSTITDWFEFEVGGSDDWPTAFSGGWVQFVVDIEATASNTNGTPPATNACQYVGITYVTASTMPRMADNVWLDEIAYLPDGTAGILVEGRNGGSTDWTWDDVITQIDTVKAATCRRADGGGVVLNTSVQFGINDATTHQFTDTNQIILFDDQEFVASDLYGFTVVGGSGTQLFRAGSKTGTGDDATGSQGWVIAAASGGQRWFFDADDANIDDVGLYGCTFIHADDFQLDNANAETISCLFNDATSATISGSLFQRNTIVNANTADGVAFITTDDLDLIKFCAFTFSDGHAILYNPTGAGPFTENLEGNVFTGYGADASTDAALLIDTVTAAANVTVETLGGVTSPSFLRAAGDTGTTTINNSVTLTFENIVSGSRLYVITEAGGPDPVDTEIYNNTVTLDPFTINRNFVSNQPIFWRVRSASGATKYKEANSTGTIMSTGYSVVVNQVLDE